MDPYRQRTQAWVRQVVIGLNLCPFAAGPERGGRIRYVLEATVNPEALVRTFLSELALLVVEPPSQVETTLLIHPNVLEKFDDYLDFAAEAEELIAEAELEGIIQLATFHPHYQFAGTAPDAVENYTNRSPYPMLHLLREDSIEQAVAGFPDLEKIPDRNIETMRRLGDAGIRKLWASL